MDLDELISKIQKYHDRGKRIQEDSGYTFGKIYLVPFIISMLVFSPIAILALEQPMHRELVGGILALLYLALLIYGHHTLLGIMQ